MLLKNHHFSRCATQVATRAGASTASNTPPRRFSTEGDKLFFSFSFDIFCEVVLFVLIFLSARLVFSDLLYHFAFPLRLASTSFRRCSNLPECSFPVTSELFGGDPCPGTGKYIEVRKKYMEVRFNRCIPLSHTVQFIHVGK